MFSRTGIVVCALLLGSGLTAVSTTASQAAAARPARHQTAGATPAGYGPADLRSAYKLAAAAAAGGTGATVAIAGVYDDPTAAADLAVYRSQYKLPACTTASGCLRKVNENGQPSPLPPAGSSASNPEWTQQEAADMDLVSAICPNCHILLVEAGDFGASDMGTAVNSAVSLGARYVIIGWSLEATIAPAAVDADFVHPGVAIVAGAGDFGYLPYCCFGRPFFPAGLQQVVSVGGTTLTRASNARGWSETVWGPPGTGNLATSSGCAGSAIGKPSWQTDSGCAGRTDNDVAADANPRTGVAVYNTSAGDHGWLVAGGTAVSAAIVGSVYALAGTPAPDSYPVTYPYLHTADLYPVTSGCDVPGCSDGPGQPGYLYQAGPGYNGPAGWGTPDGTAAFTPPASGTVAMISPGDQQAWVLPETVSLQIGATDSAGLPLTFSATGLPPGTSIDPSTGLISGTVTAYYDGQVSVTATDADGTTASVSFGWLAEDRIVIGAQSVRQVQPGTPVSLTITARDANKAQPLTYSAAGLPAGLAIGPSTGTITGTATAAMIGTYDVTVTAGDPTGSSASVTFTLHVWNTIAVTVPTAISSDEKSLVGVPIAPIDVTATDSADGQTLTYSATGLPAGLSIDPATGVISGTPTAKADVTVTVTATDGTGSQGSTSVLWFVNGKITLTSPGNQTTIAGHTVQLPLKVTDTAAGDTLIYTVTGAPPGLSVDENTAAFEGWPTAPGTYKTTVTAGEQTGGSTASVTFTWTVKPAPAAGPTGPVRLDLSGKCLDDAGNASRNGTKIQAWTCDGQASQHWTYAQDGTLRIHGKCLTASGTAKGARLQLWACDAKGGQNWAVTGLAELVSLRSGLCAADSGVTVTDHRSVAHNGTWVVLQTCLAGAWEYWTLPAGPVLSGLAGKCMTDSGGRTANGTEVVLSGCDGSRAQRWTVEPDGTIRISGKCLTLRSLAFSGAPAVLWTCGNTGYYQQWSIPLSDTLGVAIQGPSGSDLGVPPDKTANGTQLETLGNTGAAGAQWHVW